MTHTSAQSVPASQPELSLKRAVWLREAAPWLVGMLGLLVAFYPAILSGFERLQISIGDPRLVNYILEHSYLWLTGYPNHELFWSPPAFYPTPDIGAYSDTMVGSAPLYWVWRALGAGPGAAFQLWMMACLTLNYLTTYLYLRRCLRLDPWPCAFGAFLFGFGITRLANLNSPQLFPVFYCMLALHAVHRIFESGEEQGAGRRVGWILLLAGALALQVWSAYYPAFFMIFILGIAAIIGATVSEGRRLVLARLRRSHWVLALGALGSAAVVYPMISAHLSVVGEVGWRDFSYARRAMPSLPSWFYPGQKSLLYGGLSNLALFDFESMKSQHSNGVGFLTSILCIAGFLRFRRLLTVRVVVLTTLLVLVTATRWTEDFSLWRYVFEWVPGAQAIRYSARIGMFLVVPAAIGLALFLQGLKSSQWKWAAPILALFCVLEQAHVSGAWPEAEYRELVQEVASQVSPDCDAFYLFAQENRPLAQRPLPPRPPRATQVLAMWASIEARVPTVNGFYGNGPPAWTPMLAQAYAINEGAAGKTRADLSKWSSKHDMSAKKVCPIAFPADRLPWTPE